jgi:hypothetical protein
VKRFDYLLEPVLAASATAWHSELSPRLEVLGKEGWELVTSTLVPANGSEAADTALLIFRRERDQPDP